MNVPINPGALGALKRAAESGAIARVAQFDLAPVRRLLAFCDSGAWERIRNIDVGLLERAQRITQADLSTTDRAD